MAETFLTCNAAGCNKCLSQKAYVTSCSHIFCVVHGKEMVRSGTTSSCLVCGTQFPGQYDFLLANLKPNDQYKSIVLNGLNPEQVLDIAGRAISFYTYQMSIDTRTKVNALKNERRQQEENCISMSLSYQAEVLKMQRFAESLKKELEEKMREVEYHKNKVMQLIRQNKHMQFKVETYKRGAIFQKTAYDSPEQMFGTPINFEAFPMEQELPNQHWKHELFSNN